MGIPNILHENLTININFAQYCRSANTLRCMQRFSRCGCVRGEKYIPRDDDDDDDERRRKIQKSLVLQFPHQRRSSALDVEENREIKNIREYL